MLIRVLNLAFAILILPFVLPLMLLITITIIIVNRYPPFFITTRIGIDQKKFKIIKFQTLKPPYYKRDYHNEKLFGARLTKFGKFLRNMGWDELPQILNVLKGEMNFIGPRPLLPEENKRLAQKFPDKGGLIENWWNHLHEIKPGLSGWHQINLKNHNIVKYDLDYIENKNLIMYLKIFFVSSLLLVIGKSNYFKTKFPSIYKYDLSQ